MQREGLFRKRATVLVLLVLSAFLTLRCGGGSNQASQSGNGPLTGNWVINTSASQKDNTPSFTASGNWVQTGNTITGEMTISGLSCVTSSPVSGTFYGLQASSPLDLQLNFNGQIVALSAIQVNSSYTLASGFYNVPGSGCDSGDAGEWVASKQ